MTALFPEPFCKTGIIEAPTQLTIFREQTHLLGTGDSEQKGTVRYRTPHDIWDASVAVNDAHYAA